MGRPSAHAQVTQEKVGVKDTYGIVLYDSAGAIISTFGAGTQYTEADTDTTIAGTAILWEDTSDTLRAVSATKPLPVAEDVPTWCTGHAPAANTVATITKASAGAGVKNVCLGFAVSLCAGASAPAAIQLSVALIDGAAGGSTYLWGPMVISVPAVAGAIAAFIVNGKQKPGTADTAVTLEFSAAGGANTIESVTMRGTTSL